jgi:hypothetical protein
VEQIGVVAVNHSQGLRLERQVDAENVLEQRTEGVCLLLDAEGVVVDVA